MILDFDHSSYDMTAYTAVVVREPHRSEARLASIFVEVSRKKQKVIHMVAPTSSASVANAFLDIQDADLSSFPRIDPMKMQKLLFYAHAWWLAINNVPLFDEEVYAWPWGPVVPNVYGEFREFGSRPIVGKRATELVRTGNNVSSFRVREPAKPSEDVINFLRSVWSSHKLLSGTQLSNATHAPGEPWTIVKEQYGDLSRKPMIPNELIKEVFKGKLPQ